MFQRVSLVATVFVSIRLAPAAAAAVVGEEGVCDDNPCQNGGQCIDLSPVGELQEPFWQFRCSCRDGFTGIVCQQRVTTPCAAEPCVNGGVCIPRWIGYHCRCPEHYEGRHCETSKVLRESCDDDHRPCGPNGHCFTVNNGVYCECHPGHRGVRCEMADDAGEKGAAGGGGVEEDSQATLHKFFRAVIFITLIAVIIISTACTLRICCGLSSRLEALSV